MTKKETLMLTREEREAISTTVSMLVDKATEYDLAAAKAVTKEFHDKIHNCVEQEKLKHMDDYLDFAISRPDEFIDSLKLGLYLSGTTDQCVLSDFENKIVDYLISIDSKLKDHFLADLSWANLDPNKLETRNKVITKFFTQRKGKELLNKLPEDIKNFVIANSL